MSEVKWVVITDPEGPAVVYKEGKPRERVCIVQDDCSARLIVKAVNNHARLVEALRNLLSRVENDADAKSWFLSEQENARTLLTELEGE